MKNNDFSYFIVIQKYLRSYVGILLYYIYNVTMMFLKYLHPFFILPTYRTSSRTHISHRSHRITVLYKHTVSQYLLRI